MLLVEPAHSARLDRGGDLDVPDVAGYGGHDVALPVVAVVHCFEHHFAEMARCDADGENYACFHVLHDVALDEIPEPLLHAPDVAEERKLQTEPAHAVLCASDCVVFYCYDAALFHHALPVFQHHVPVFALQSMVQGRHCCLPEQQVETLAVAQVVPLVQTIDRTDHGSPHRH